MIKDNIIKTKTFILTTVSIPKQSIANFRIIITIALQFIISFRF